MLSSPAGFQVRPRDFYSVSARYGSSYSRQRLQTGKWFVPTCGPPQALGLDGTGVSLKL